MTFAWKFRRKDVARGKFFESLCSFTFDVLFAFQTSKFGLLHLVKSCLKLSDIYKTSWITQFSCRSWKLWLKQCGVLKTQTLLIFVQSILPKFFIHSQVSRAITPKLEMQTWRSTFKESKNFHIGNSRYIKWSKLVHSSKLTSKLTSWSKLVHSKKLTSFNNQILIIISFQGLTN